MFNVTEYLNSITISKDDETYIQATDHARMTAIICDDAYLTRQAYFGIAGAMDRQLEYLGGTLLPSVEQRIRTKNSSGIMAESYVLDHQLGFSNSMKEHINAEYDEQEDNDAKFKEELEERMFVAGVMCIVNILAHDDVSKDINQMSYGQIRGRAAQNKKKNDTNAKRQRTRTRNAEAKKTA
jgi:hypothetical protein